VPRARYPSRLNGFARGSLDPEERPPRVTRHARSRLITLGSCAEVARGDAISRLHLGIDRSIDRGPRSLALVTHLLPVFARVSFASRSPRRLGGAILSYYLSACMPEAGPSPVVGRFLHFRAAFPRRDTRNRMCDPGLATALEIFSTHLDQERSNPSWGIHATRCI